MAAISVIIPVYKVEKYIRRCLDSVLAQSFEDFDLVLIDDGSPDKCPEICDEYADTDPRIFVIHQSNSGLSAARNQGLEWSLRYSDSQWITFVDSDDWIQQNYLALLHETAVSLQVDLCICEFKKTKENYISEEIKSPCSERKRVKEIYTLENVDLPLIESVGKLFRKGQWKEIRFPEGRIHEDRFTTHKLLFQNQFIGIIHAPLYFYFQGGDSITRCAWSPRRLDDLDAVAEQLQYFEDHRLFEAWKKAALSQLSILGGTINEIKKCSPKYDCYLPSLHRQLQISLRKNRTVIPVPIEKYAWLYELAFPAGMRMYWYFQAIKKRFLRARKRWLKR